MTNQGEECRRGFFLTRHSKLLRTSSDGVFSSLFTYYPTRKTNVMVNGQAELASGEYVSGDYFRRGSTSLPAAGTRDRPE